MPVTAFNKKTIMRPLHIIMPMAGEGSRFLKAVTGIIILYRLDFMRKPPQNTKHPLMLK